MKKFIISVLILSSLFIMGCEDSDNLVNTSNKVDGLSLLGLVNGRNLVYLQTDTTISPDTYSITFDDTVIAVSITGSGDDWIIYKGTDKLINLKIASTSILQNGYWKKFNGQDSLIYYASPPLIMERNLVVGEIIHYYTPFYFPESSPKYLPYNIANFGYKVDKEYMGLETIITPAGEFNAHRYDLQLFTSAFGEDPIAFVTEFYVPQIGLVKQSLNIGALRRTLILANYSD